MQCRFLVDGVSRVREGALVEDREGEQVAVLIVEEEEEKGEEMSKSSDEGTTVKTEVQACANQGEVLVEPPVQKKEGEGKAEESYLNY